jgi:hypothetical protein
MGFSLVQGFLLFLKLICWVACARRNLEGRGKYLGEKYIETRIAENM